MGSFYPPQGNNTVKYTLPDAIISALGTIYTATDPSNGSVIASSVGDVGSVFNTIMGLGGANIEIKDGSYLQTTKVNVTPAGVTIKGGGGDHNGSGTKIQVDTDKNPTLDKMFNVTGRTFRMMDICLDGQQPVNSTTTIGVDITGTPGGSPGNYPILDNVEFKLMPGHAVRLTGVQFGQFRRLFSFSSGGSGASADFYIDNTQYSIFDQCYTYNTSNSTAIYYLIDNTSYNSFTDCVSNTNAGFIPAFVLQGSGANGNVCDFNTFKGCIIQNLGAGFKLLGAKNNTIDSCVIQGLPNNVNAINLLVQGARNCTRNTVVGCQIDTCGRGILENDANQDFNTYAFNQITNATVTTMSLAGVNSYAHGNNGFNPQGVAAITPGASPYTYTNQDAVMEVITIDGGTVTTVAKNAITLYSFGGAAARCAVTLMPNESLTVTYTVVPTMNKDRK